MEKPALALEDGLDLRKVVTSGSLLQINGDYNDSQYYYEAEKTKTKPVDFIGLPVKSFEVLAKEMVAVDPNGLVKKKIIDEGGGLPINIGCTVHIGFSGYWEKTPEPFDVRMPDKPLVVDLNDSGLLPGLEMAVESMLVGEMSVFLLSYKVMYGELGIPPRIKPKADCVFFIKLVKSILTPAVIRDHSTSNIFHTVYHEVKLLYASGVTLYKSNNSSAAIQLFRKAVFMLHNCRLADEEEEKIQEKMLIKLYMNQAVCYNATRQPLRTCIACNELNRLNSLWNNGKAMFQNAKALRMIGEFEAAEKKLRRAMKLCSNMKELDDELTLLKTLSESYNKSKLISNRIESRPSSVEQVGDDFKREVDTLIKNFKENVHLCKFNLPEGLNSLEIEYIKNVCLKENLFVSKIQRNFALDKDAAKTSNENFQSDDNE